MIWISAFRIVCTFFKRVNSHFKFHQRLVSVYKYNQLCMHRRNWVFLNGVSVNRLLPITIIHFHEFFTRVIKLHVLAQWAPSIIRSLQGLLTTNVSIFCLWLTTYESIWVVVTTIMNMKTDELVSVAISNIRISPWAGLFQLAIPASPILLVLKLHWSLLVEQEHRWNFFEIFISVLQCSSYTFACQIKQIAWLNLLIYWLFVINRLFS